jgi:hypothetical protein
MLIFRTIPVALPFLFLSVLISYNVNAQTYLPVGPQTNVPVVTVTGGGWTECYRDIYNAFLEADTVLANCPGDKLMLSCRLTGSSILTLLAQGDRSDVTFDTGDTESEVHVANDVGWYFNNGPSFDHGFSWGFVREGDNVEKNNCDVDSSGANDERLCWHLSSNGGYRCGVSTGLNASVDFERIVYTNSTISRNIPTLSDWGLISAAGGLGLIGIFFALKRRKLTNKADHI